MSNATTCALCNSEASFRSITAHKNAITCQRCGEYTLTDTGESIIREKPIQNRGAVSGWIRRQNAMGLTPNVTSYNLDEIRAFTKPH
jgi:hypothetical protein